LVRKNASTALPYLLRIVIESLPLAINQKLGEVPLDRFASMLFAEKSNTVELIDGSFN